MATCRCPMCGSKNASKKCKDRKLYHAYGVGRSEDNRSWDCGFNRDSERRLLRRRMKQDLNNQINEQLD